MAKRQGRGGGRFRGSKRTKTQENTNTSLTKRSTRSRQVQGTPSPSLSPTVSGDSSEEELSPSSNVMPEEVVVYKEPSTYDNLLMTLGSGNGAFANIYKRRKREEEGQSGTEDDEDDSSEDPSLSGEEGDEEGSADELGAEDAMRTHVQESAEADNVDLLLTKNHSDDAETASEEEASDTDEEDDYNGENETAVDASQIASSFNIHLGYNLKQAEVEDLAKRKCKYKWEMNAIGLPMSKWVGTGEGFLKETNCNWGYDVKPKLYKHWLDIHKTCGGNEVHSSRRRQFFTICNSYRDILHSNKKPFYLKGFEEDSSIMDAYIMHALNHVFKTRDLLTKNEAKLAKNREGGNEVILNGDEFLDHGFTRPKVLILLPLASVALRVVKRLIQLTPQSNRVNVEHFDRFSDEFGTGEVKGDDENNGSGDGEISERQKSAKPSDFQSLFGGNNNDHFMIGIKYTRRSIKLYSDFYLSDMIVASPLGLITVHEVLINEWLLTSMFKFSPLLNFNTDGNSDKKSITGSDFNCEQMPNPFVVKSNNEFFQASLLKKIGEAEFDKEKDVDYLSSIEVLVVDHADVISMQNWSHVNSVVEQLNHIPSKQHGTDVMRIRQWYLNGHARWYRQTILLGSFLNPDMNALFNQHCASYQGKVKLVSEYKSVLPKVLLPVRQIYRRFDVDSIVEADDVRLEYFAKEVFPKIKDSIQGGTMLFISSYFEFVRIRNFLKSQNASFCLLGEYTKQSDISRARIWFFEGTRKIMLYTERAHFYHRYKIRGMKNLIVYSLPERKEFYPEIINMVEASENTTCTVLFSRFDKLRLERIVGTTPAKKLMSSEKSTFVFC